MSKYADKTFWTDTADRAISTMAQTAVATLTANATGIIGLDWMQLASVVGLAGAVSILQAVAFRGEPVTKDKVLAAHAVLTADEQEADQQAALTRR